MIQLTIGLSKNLLSQIETSYVGSYMTYCHIGTSSYQAQSSFLFGPEHRHFVDF